MVRSVTPSNFTVLGSNWGDWRACTIYAIIYSSPALQDFLLNCQLRDNYILVDPDWLDNLMTIDNPNSTIFSFLERPASILSAQWTRVTSSCMSKRLLTLLGGNPEIVGLPCPKVLSTLDIDTVCLGSPDSIVLGQSRHIAFIPAFPFNFEHIEYNAMQIALWILSIQCTGLAIIRIDAEPREIACMIWSALGVCTTSSSDLRDRTDVFTKTSSKSLSRPLCRPLEDLIYTYHHASSCVADVSICISLYNYQAFIKSALDSCLRQSLSRLELIIVDDCSTDLGPQVAHSWIQKHGTLFASSMLLSHKENKGLAQARNTAIQVSSAEWFFVLDADNRLKPYALDKLFRFAQSLSSRVAVVHPLISLDYGEHPNENDGFELIGNGEPWSYYRMIHGNIVDAMALVRKSAWETVGGYSHLEYGWEDFDFWCKLIDEGYIGVQFPQVLAQYRKHSDSMLQSISNANHDRLVGILHERHPWLRLSKIE